MFVRSDRTAWDAVARAGGQADVVVPEWFDVASVPLGQMWDDEAYWLPQVMAGETFVGVISYDDDCKLVARAEPTAAAGPLTGL